MRQVARRRLVALVSAGVVVVLAIAVGTAALLSSRAGSGEISASSTAPGYSAESLLGGSGGAGGWRSADSDADPTVTVRFRAARAVNLISVAAPEGGSSVRRGHVEFLDGSAVAFTARPGGRSFSIRFATRTTNGFAVVADTRGGDSKHVQYSRISWDRDPGSAIAASGRPAVAASSRQSSLPAGATDGDLGGWYPGEGDPDPSIRLSWTRPREVRVVTARGQPGSAPFVGSVSFSDGSSIDLGVVTAARSTTAAFMARVTSSITVTAKEGRLSLATLSVSPEDAASTRSAPARTEAASAPRTCADAGSPAAGTRLTILCPTPGTEVGESGFRIRARTAPGTPVTARAYLPALRAVEQIAVARSDGTGLVDLPVATRKLLRGPLNVLVSAGLDDSAVVQVVNRSGVDDPERDTRPKGLQPVYTDTFDGPASVSVDGASTRYAALKPSADGATQFGDAPFSDPAAHPDQIAAVSGGWLRLQLSAVADAAGAKRQEGAMIASYSSAGSGFAALDGYFEARILGGPGRGAWPAFWMLSADSAYRPGIDVSEVDAVELYGHDGRATCHSTHNYRPGKDDVASVGCVPLRKPDDDWALRWHTYATRITANEAVFLVDGEVVRRAPRSVAEDQPMFFLLNIAAGGGWPVDLSPTFDTSQMYVDWVRVSV